MLPSTRLLTSLRAGGEILQRLEQLATTLSGVGERQEQLATSLSGVGERQEQLATTLSGVGERQEQLATTLSHVQSTVSGLLGRQMDPWDSISHSTTDTMREIFKKDLEREYGPAKCMVTGVQVENKVVAAHIWPASACDSIRLGTLNLTTDDIMTWRNGIFLLKELERSFDRKRVGFVYISSTDKFIFRVFDGTLLNTTVSGASVVEGRNRTKLTYKQLEGRNLVVPNDKMPYRRLLIWHYAACQAKAKHLGWSPLCADLPAVPEPDRMSRVLSWLERSPGVTWPDVGQLAYTSAKVESDPLSTSVDSSCRLNQSSAVSEIDEVLRSGADNYGNDDDQLPPQETKDA